MEPDFSLELQNILNHFSENPLKIIIKGHDSILDCLEVKNFQHFLF